MLEKGTMINVKKGIGYGLLAIGGYLLINFDSAMIYIHKYSMIFSIVLLAAGYFLAISGRQL